MDGNPRAIKMCLNVYYWPRGSLEESGETQGRHRKHSEEKSSKEGTKKRSKKRTKPQKTAKSEPGGMDDDRRPRQTMMLNEAFDKSSRGATNGALNVAAIKISNEKKMNTGCGRIAAKVEGRCALQRMTRRATKRGSRWERIWRTGGEQSR